MPTVDGILEAIRGLTPTERAQLIRALDEAPATSRAPAAKEVSEDMLVHCLRESERRLEEAQRIAHVGYWDRDLVLGRMTLSDEACRIFGFPPEARIVDLAKWHRQWVSLIHPEDRVRTAEAVADALDGRRPYDVEYRIVRPGGDTRVVHSRAAVTRDETGSAVRICGMMLDITDLRHAEHARQASEVRFRTLVEHAADGVFLLDANRLPVRMGVFAATVGRAVVGRLYDRRARLGQAASVGHGSTRIVKTVALTAAG